MENEPVITRVARARRIGVIRPSLSSKSNAKQKFRRAGQRFQWQQYKHSTIDAKTTVRLLVFEELTDAQLQDEDNIHISLLNVSFADLGTKIEYEALSYHWGQDEAVYPIYFLDTGDDVAHFQDLATLAQHIVNTQIGHARGKNKTSAEDLVYKRLYVRPSLYQALKHLRRQATGKGMHALWVDAICINQEDEEEKMLQVSRMAEIYSKAYRVCIWLGVGNDRTDNAMVFIRELLEAPDPELLMTGERYAKHWNDLVTIMTQEWFSRRWVIQELALAKEATVHCGSRVVCWDDFRDAISLLRLHVDSIRDLFKKSQEFEHNFWAIGDIDLFGASVLVDVIPNVFRKHSTKTSLEPALGLETLVSTYAMFDSSDPRDTIMAMRNIAKETISNSRYKQSSEPPQLNYRKDLFEVYSDFVYWVITTSESLDILCRHWARPERGENDPKPPQYPPLVKLPTWILETPKRSRYQISQQNQSRLRGDSFVGLPGFASYNACNGKKPEVKLARLDPVLHKASNEKSMTQATGAENSTVPLSINHDSPEDDQRPQESSTNFSRDSCEENFGNGISPEGSEPASPAPLQVQQFPAALSGVRRSISPIMGPRPESPTIGKNVDQSLYVKGLRMGRITWRSDPIADGVIPQIGLSKCGWSPDLDSDDQNLDFEIDKVLRTLVADRGADGRNPPTWYHRACEKCLMKHLSNGHMNTRDLMSSKQPFYVKQFLKRVQAVTWDRVFLQTNPEAPSSSPLGKAGLGGSGSSPAEKLVGLGPNGTRRGDILAILYGCSVPVVLREFENESQERFFYFIGEAFVYGKMDGEAVSMLSAEELNEQTEEFRLV